LKIFGLTDSFFDSVEFGMTFLFEVCESDW
jgi:hypothetical protein